MGIIETKKLTKYYGKSRGIVEVDLSIEEGEIFGFIGPNGAGKSTTIRLLLDLIKPTQGSASIFGLDCQKEYRKIHEEIGYLPSEVFYYDNMKVKDLLSYSASFYRKDCSAKIKELAKRLDLDLNRKIDDLSYGNKKKVGIVQGLLHSPKVIILDEPTGGLDPLMQQTFFEILKEENKRGATVLFSSHILSEVQKICDRVAIIKDGKIVRIDTMSSLKENTYLKVDMETKSLLPEHFFNGSMNNVKVNGSEVSFLYNGEANELLKKLSLLDVSRISMSEPDLEEIFMHYYEKE
ncbi:MAG: ABC transporter ATP-binding protein [Erysipelotrichaceae bacterium]|nr:ABC transporter ATP-binding protein [Erysipelotrichaceae bacterium]